MLVCACVYVCVHVHSFIFSPALLSRVRVCVCESSKLVNIAFTGIAFFSRYLSLVYFHKRIAQSLRCFRVLSLLSSFFPLILPLLFFQFFFFVKSSSLTWNPRIRVCAFAPVKETQITQRRERAVAIADEDHNTVVMTTGQWKHVQLQ